MTGPWPAAAVHLFTALGAVCGLLAAMELRAHAWEAMFGWLGLALVIDGCDGVFARMVRVEQRLPRFSGERLDLIVDYVTYVFVPVLALLEAGYLTGVTGVVLAALILLSSLYHFADVDSKSADNSFVGFPAVWNLVAFYIFALDPPLPAVLAVGLVGVVLSFVPMKWVHPVRVRHWRLATLLVVAIWSVTAATVLRRGFPAAGGAALLLLASCLYIVAISLLSLATARGGGNSA